MRHTLHGYKITGPGGSPAEHVGIKTGVGLLTENERHTTGGHVVLDKPLIFVSYHHRSGYEWKLAFHKRGKFNLIKIYISDMLRFSGTCRNR